MIKKYSYQVEQSISVTSVEQSDQEIDETEKQLNQQAKELLPMSKLLTMNEPSMNRSIDDVLVDLGLVKYKDKVVSIFFVDALYIY